MKIAAISEDGVTISQHFGRAPLYVVLTVEDGKVIAQETRPKAGHHTFAAQGHFEQPSGERHGYDAGSQARHAAMASNISDCQVLLVGGMGRGAYESMKNQGIESIVTDIQNINAAVKAYLDGSIKNLFNRLH